MDRTRIEIMPGVWLNHTRSDKFKTSLMSISLLSQLCRENASMNALIPFVLRRGTRKYPDMEKLSCRLDELYGSAVEPFVRRIGEIQAVGFVASFPERSYLPDGANTLEGTCELLSELLLSPCTRGGLFLPQYVESERDKLIDIINSRINEKRGYALTRCIEEMCCFEDYSVGRYGSADDCRSINYKKLTKHYHSLLQSSPIEIFYCGRESCETVAEQLKESLCTLPRGEIDYDIGTDVRMNSVEENARYYEEKLDVTQGKLVIGFRLGDYMEDPSRAALQVFNAVYGSGVTSKLFMNVREKLSLCYYASSMVDTRKGLLLVSSGIEFDKFEEAKAEIMHQLDEIKAGNITDDELKYAKTGLISDCAALLDSQGEIETYTIGRVLDGDDCTPEEYAEQIEAVDKEEIIKIANSVECDMVYFLKGEGNDENDEN